MTYRNQLIKGGRKWNCPACGKKTFVRMQDTTTGEFLPEEFGRCDREDNCSYENLKAPIRFDSSPYNFISSPLRSIPAPERTYIPEQLVRESLVKYDINPLVRFLEAIAGKEKAIEVAGRYRIGTSSAGVVFWYIDQMQRVHYGAVMGYEITTNPVNNSGKDCKRIKGKNTSAVKSLIQKATQRDIEIPVWAKQYEQNENKISCPFGAHILKENPSATICMVEAPKTAIIASLYFPEYLWLAIGAKSWLNVERCSTLIDRKVILWPDLGAFHEWKEKAKQLSTIGEFKVNHLIEAVATDEDRTHGLDLADYLLRHPIPNEANRNNGGETEENITKLSFKLS